MTNPEWIQAGYFLISPGNSPWRGNDILPAHIVTASTCVVECFPGSWGLSWDNTPEVEQREHQNTLGLNAAGYSDLQSWVGKAFDNGEFGWPNVLLSLDAARDFWSRFLGTIGTQIRLIGLSIASDLAGDLISTYSPRRPGHGASGVWTMVQRDESLDRSGILLGFDVLGDDVSMHTFSCNGLEKDYSELLGISFNTFGLIDEYPEAVAAYEYTNRDEVGAEPVPWFPFRVDEYPPQAAG